MNDTPHELWRKILGYITPEFKIDIILQVYPDKRENYANIKISCNGHDSEYHIYILRPQIPIKEYDEENDLLIICHDWERSDFGIVYYRDDQELLIYENGSRENPHCEGSDNLDYRCQSYKGVPRTEVNKINQLFEYLQSEDYKNNKEHKIIKF